MSAAPARAHARAPVAASRTAAPKRAAAAPKRSPAAAAVGPPAVTLGPGAARQARERAVMGRVRGAAQSNQGVAQSPATARTASNQAAIDASAATPPPQNEALATGQSGQIGNMAGAQPGEVNQRSFLQIVDEQLARVPMPENPKQMEEFQQRGGANGLREQVQGAATSQASGAQSAIRDTTSAPTTPVPSPEAVPRPTAPAAPQIGSVSARAGLPDPRPAEEVSLSQSQSQVQADMDREHLDDERLREANDPRFTAVGQARDAVSEQADRGPREYRSAESGELRRATTLVSRDEQANLRGMGTARGTTDRAVDLRQQAQMAREAAERRAVAHHIESIFTGTQTAVQNKLDWLDREVDGRFGRAETSAKEAFEGFVSRSMRDWKIRRYGSRALIPVVGLIVSAGTWAYDQLRGIDHFPEVRQIFVDGKREYTTLLRAAIVDISSLVDETLAWCQTRIQQGRDEVRDYVATLRTDLREVGEEAARGVNERLTELRNTVNERRDALASRLVERYRQSMTALDQRIEQMRAENRGLVARFVDAIREVWQIIQNFRRQLMSLLAEVRDVVERIIAHPVRFIGNLVRALRQGFDQFKNKIGDYLREGLLGWLFGALESAGVRLPTSFDLRSIIGFILGILGITTDRIRAKVARIIGERNMAILERVWGYVVVLVREGPIGLWQHIRQDLSSLWEMALDAVKSWVITRIVQSAVARLVSMFNPAGAIIQAALAIYNTVMFFIERINQIMELVRTIVRALDKIERGDIGDAANWVERAMARAIPVIISFLARLLGLGGISDTIRGFITRIQERVDRVIDRVLDRIVAGIRRLFGGGRGQQPANARGQDSANAEMTRDVPTPLANHPHTLRAAVVGGRLQFFMASNGFAALESRLDEILNQECPPATVTRWRAEATNYQRRSGTVPTQLQQKLDRYEGLKTRIRDLKTEIQQHAQSYATQPDAAAKQRVFDRALAEGTRMLIAIRDDFGIVSGELSSLVVPHEHSMNALGAKSHGRSGGMHATIGPNSPARPTSPSGTVPGTSIFGYSRGHLLAASLGGPNSAGAAGWNFAAMDQQTNTASAGMQGPEQAGRNAINAGVVLDYSVIPHYEPSATAFGAWLTANLATAVPNPADVLFIAAQNNNTNAAHLGSVLQLGGPIPAALYPPLLLRLAYYFLPHHFTVTISVVRQPSGVAFTLPSGVQGNRQNHMGKSPKPCP